MVEQVLANDSLSRWVYSHTNPGTNPLAPTSENLAPLERSMTSIVLHATRSMAAATIGSKHIFTRQLQSYDGVQKLSDGELYFIVANGIAYSAMPGFGKEHSPGDIWRTVLWVRHLAHLTPAAKAAMELETKAAGSKHEHTMEPRGEK